MPIHASYLSWRAEWEDMVHEALVAWSTRSFPTLSEACAAVVCDDDAFDYLACLRGTSLTVEAAVEWEGRMFEREHADSHGRIRSKDLESWRLALSLAMHTCLFADAVRAAELVGIDAGDEVIGDAHIIRRLS